jgi:hypothetical protein
MVIQDRDQLQHQRRPRRRGELLPRGQPLQEFRKLKNNLFCFFEFVEF